MERGSPHLLPGQPSPKRATPPCASCSATSRRKKPSTTTWPGRWTSSRKPPAHGKRRTRASGGVSCSRWCSRGLAGLMDGSVSTLAPVFAAAFASHNSWTAFLVGHGGIHRRGHQHGVCRSAFGRRRAQRARAPLDPWAGVRADDDRGRHRAHAAVFDRQLLLRHVRGRGRRRRRTGGDRLDSTPLHGYAAAFAPPSRSSWAACSFSSSES